MLTIRKVPFCCVTVEFACQLWQAEISLLMGVNSVNYEPQGTEVIQSTHSQVDMRTIINQKITLTGKGLSKMRAFSPENVRILCKLDGKCMHFRENAQN